MKINLIWKALAKIYITNFYFTASKIHITSEVNDELTIIGGFKTELRGLIDVKVSSIFVFLKNYYVGCEFLCIFREKD